MDAINVVFNVFVGSVLVIGAFGLTVDAELPDSEAAKSPGFTKKLTHPRPAEGPIPDACKWPGCDGPASIAGAPFVERREVVRLEAPDPAPTQGAKKRAHAVEKEDVIEQPAKKHGRGPADDGADRAREKAEKEARKAIEKAQEEARKALKQARKAIREDGERDDREHDEDKKDD